MKDPDDSRSVLALMLLAALMCLGCPPVPEAVIPPEPDARVDYLPRIETADGRWVELNDGRRVELRGVDVAGLNRAEREAFNEAIHYAAGKPATVVNYGGEARLLYYPHYPRAHYVRPGNGDDRGGVLTADQPVDLGVEIVRNGLAPAAPAEVTDADVRRQLTEAQDEAKAELRGIWHALLRR